MIALDRKPDLKMAFDLSARHKDADGQLHVTLTNISKANVCPYYGREIPVDGLDPDKIYYLYRDPTELARAAETFNGKQLMGVHIVVSADDPQHQRIVGAIGTDSVFDDPYLKASITVWDAEAISQIENGEVAEISCGYRYVADMTPGTHNSLTFDGVMRNIICNHVALVPEGRAGPDVVVADSKLGEPSMKLTSKAAMMAKGAIAAYVRPLIAADAKLDVSLALKGVTAKTFAADKAKIATRIAKDAKLDADGVAGLTLALDAMEREIDAEDEDDMGAEDEDKDCPAEDGDPEEMEAEDESEEAAEVEAKKAADAALAKARRRAPNSNQSPRIAVDAAKIRADTIAEMRAISTAEREVHPHVGEVSGMDSAEAVYKFALDKAGIDTKGVHPSAFRAMVKMLPDPDAERPRVALDAKAGASVVAMFPGLANIRQA